MSRVLAIVLWCRDKFISSVEESPGVVSSARMVMWTLTMCTVLITVTVCVYLLRRGPDAGVVGAVGAVIASLLGGLAYVTGKRGTGV